MIEYDGRHMVAGADRVAMNRVVGKIGDCEATTERLDRYAAPADGHDIDIVVDCEVELARRHRD